MDQLPILWKNNDEWRNYTFNCWDDLHLAEEYCAAFGHKSHSTVYVLPWPDWCYKPRDLIQWHKPEEAEWAEKKGIIR